MERITNLQQKPVDNIILANPEKSSIGEKSYIQFRGSGNILFMEEGASLGPGSTINFMGNNALAYIRRGFRPLLIKSNISPFCCLYIGSNFSTPPPATK